VVATQIPVTEQPTSASHVLEVIRTAALVAVGSVVVGLVGALSVVGIVGALWRGAATPSATD
jgi:hypothetical protein